MPASSRAEWSASPKVAPSVAPRASPSPPSRPARRPPGGSSEPRPARLERPLEGSGGYSVVVAGGGMVGAALASPSTVGGAEVNPPLPVGPLRPMAGGALAMLLRGEALPTALLLPSRASLTVLGAAGSVLLAAPPPATLLPPGGEAPPATLAGAL